MNTRALPLVVVLAWGVGCAKKSPAPDAGGDAARDDRGDAATDGAAPGDAIEIEDGRQDSSCRSGAPDVRVSDGERSFVDLDVSATGFDEHNGQTVRLLTLTSDSRTVAGEGRATIVSGGFAFHFPDAYQRGFYQEVFWFLDGDGDGLCSAATGDHQGYKVTDGFNPSGNAPYDLFITDNHVGTDVRGDDVCSVMNRCR